MVEPPHFQEYQKSQIDRMIFLSFSGQKLKKNIFLKPPSSILPKTNIAPEKIKVQKVSVVFQPSIFRCELFKEG